MDIFSVRERLIEDYRSYVEGFLRIRDERIKRLVGDEFENEKLWPEPWLSMNPAFATGGGIDHLVADGVLHPGCAEIFRVDGQGLRLHQHQREALTAARDGASYVLTTGTGSGKSLTYLVPIVDHVLRQGSGRGVRAIIVYPMNALANSQYGELTKFLGTKDRKVTFERYTGQESERDRRRIQRNPPDVLLTNYVMLDLLLTRPDERRALITNATGLRFLVLDELHTYRGRQGADVAMLVRRVRDASGSPSVQCVGTSATMGDSGLDGPTVEDVASRLFGVTVKSNHVIGETLRRATTVEPNLTDGELREAVSRAADGTDPRDHPLAAWAESRFGVERRDGRLVRRAPTKLSDATRELADSTGLGTGTCGRALRDILLAGSRCKDQYGRSLFAFRLHQFIGKGDTVYSSVEPPATRHLTTRKQVAVPGRRDTLLFPLAFCRDCGQEYLAVVRDPQGFLPRYARDTGGSGSAQPGYLYLSETAPWPDDDTEVARRVPGSWLVGAIVDPDRKKKLPETVWVRPDGSADQTGRSGQRAAFVAESFEFCLECRVAYGGRRGEFAKLATLGTEGRSSATTTMVSSLIRTLQRANARPKARKVLAFTDNRQDASLQAGHFNDFVLVGLIRSALYRALKAAAGSDGLRHDTLTGAVMAALNPRWEDYARDPELLGPAREDTERALREAIGCRLYQDLQRGWRITMPNLEQCGLLLVDYVGLEQACGNDDVWAWPLADVPADTRAKLARALLNEMRRGLAIQTAVLTGEGFDAVVQLSDRLTDSWAIRDEDRATAPRVWPHSRPKDRRRGGTGDIYLSGRTVYGRFLADELRAGGNRMPVDDREAAIVAILGALTRYGLVVPTEDRRGRSFQVAASALRWLPGDGTRLADPRYQPGDTDGKPNQYFVAFYQKLAAELAGLRSAEHTAQVPAALREIREVQFREAELSALFCSPTMELGIDISDLNAVVLRNAPPTPANYSQRSGRAGRAGQPAIVVTYCTTGSAHDQYYFRESRRMVAGQIAPPRLDLTNPDLVRAHVHAIWLAETGESLGKSLLTLLDTAGDPPSLGLKPELRTALSDSGAATRATERARRVLGDVPEIASAPWYDEDWVRDTIADAVETLDRRCDRWREAYWSARAEMVEAHEKMSNLETYQHRSSDSELNNAKARHSEALTKLKLLTNESDELSTSDFYSYRYFATEGFLPGYAFPRLPVSAYIPGRRGARNEEGDYVSRPRFLAVSEFGPGAIVYHEGARYEVVRVSRPARGGTDGGLALDRAKRCDLCGTLWNDDDDVCTVCDAPLGPAMTNLLRMTTATTRRRDRISSDEEERRRQSFDIATAIRLTTSGPEARRDALVRASDGGELAHLTYADTATIRRMNMRRRRSRVDAPNGYWIDPSKGQWLSEELAAGKPADNPAELVIPYVEDRRNALVLRWSRPLPSKALATLQWGLKRAIQTAFDLEDNELAAEGLPDRTDRDRILFYESAEGGAGALRGLVANEHDELGVVAREALRLLHFDQDGNDLERPEGDRPDDDWCELACYDCLLSYGNQPDHLLLNRHLIVGELRALAEATIEPVLNHAHPEPVLDEHPFLDLLRSRNARLPNAAGVTIDEARARPDFVYELASGRVAVFLDADGLDEDAAERLRTLEYHVVHPHTGEDWDAMIDRLPSVFAAERS